MRDPANRRAVSVVCMVQLLLCLLLAGGILLFRQFGGRTYEAAREWYSNAAENTVLVYPETEPSSSEDDG